MAALESAQVKLALVTGGQRRLGAAIAARLAADGWALALHAGHAGTLDTALTGALADALPRHGARWHGFVADLSDPVATDALVDQVADHFGVCPALLVNNAARFDDDDAESANAASLLDQYRVNALAPQALALALGRRTNGDDPAEAAVVNIVDQRVRNPVPDQLSYSLSKAALGAATRTLAVALAPRVRVNAVAPGLTIPTDDYAPGQMERVASAMPLRRLATPDDIADAVLYFAAARGVTGQTLFVDGGASLKSFDRDFVNL